MNGVIDRASGLLTLGWLAVHLGAGELASLAYLGRRLLAGQRQYGRVDLAHDRRDFELERAAELGDALVYTAFAELRRVLRARARRGTP